MHPRKKSGETILLKPVELYARGFQLAYAEGKQVQNRGPAGKALGNRFPQAQLMGSRQDIFPIPLHLVHPYLDVTQEFQGVGPGPVTGPGLEVGQLGQGFDLFLFAGAIRVRQHGMEMGSAATENPSLKPCWSEPKAKISLFQGDIQDIIPTLLEEHPGGFADVIFADPPYFLSNGGITCQAGKMVKVDKGDWDKSQGPELNHQFNLTWLRLCQSALKPDGTIWVSGTHHVIHSVGYAMQQLGMKILNDITWEKPNPPPNLACKYFTHATETIIWAAKNNNSKHYFDYPLMKKINGGKQMKSIWRFTAPGKDEKEFGKHPTQKPVELIKHCLLASSQEGAVVLDPFNGAGTTGIAALMLEREYIGIEIEKEYLDLSIKRFKGQLSGAKQLSPISESWFMGIEASSVETPEKWGINGQRDDGYHYD